MSGYTISSEIMGLPEKLDPYTTEGEVQLVKTFQDFTSVVNSSVVCLFSTFALGLPDYTGMLSCIAGLGSYRSGTADDRRAGDQPRAADPQPVRS